MAIAFQNKTPTQAIKSPVFLTGHIVSSSAVGWYSLVSEEDTPQQEERPGDLSLRLADGSVLALHIASLSRCLLPQVNRTNLGWILSRSKLLSALASEEIQPWKFLSLRGTILTNGDPVALYGEIKELTFAEVETLSRESAPQKASVIEVKLLATGDNAQEKVSASYQDLEKPFQEKPLPRWAIWLQKAPWFWVLLVLVWSLDAVLRKPSLNLLLSCAFLHTALDFHKNYTPGKGFVGMTASSLLRMGTVTASIGCAATLILWMSTTSNAYIYFFVMLGGWHLLTFMGGVGEARTATTLIRTYQQSKSMGYASGDGSLESYFSVEKTFLRGIYWLIFQVVITIIFLVVGWF